VEGLAIGKRVLYRNKMGGQQLIYVVQDREMWQTPLNMVTELLGYIKSRELLD
jgi:hypothetical protein